MKKFIFFLVSFILISNCVILPQSNYNKVGGVGFRVDDSQYFIQERLVPLDNVFNERNLNFTYCVNFGIGTSQALLDYLLIMQLDGDQIADHTPDHETRFFDVPLSEQSFYEGINATYPNGVDHIYLYNYNRWPVNATVARVCLKVDQVLIHNPNSQYSDIPNEGLINISGNTVTSVTPNEFTTNKLTSTLDNYSMNVIYIPYLDKLFKFDPTYPNVTGNKINVIKSFWDEDVSFPTPLYNLQYYKVRLYDVIYTSDALRVMATRTQRMCDANGIIRPASWIQPGGRHPQFYKADIKAALESMGYSSAGVFADPFPPYYNSYDPDDDHRYGINWEDFNEENFAVSLSQLKNTIANRFAKHYVSIGHSHLLNGISSGEFQDYLQRTTDILDWCIAKGIPVKTYTEWADLLYRTPQNPYVNVMPKLENDLDENGTPDAFTIFSGSSLDKNDGPNQDGFQYSISTNNQNYFCQVTGLGGIERGENYFGLWIKGFSGNTIGVNIKLNYLSGTSSETWYFINANNTGWQKYDLSDAYSPPNATLIIPDNVSTIDVTIKQAGNSGVSKIGGFELRKNYTGNIFPPFLLRPSFNLSTNSAKIIWVDQSSNETGFRVKRKFEGQNDYTIIIDNLPTNTTNYTDPILDLPDELRLLYPDSIKVYYQVEAFTGSSSITSNSEMIKIKTNQILPVELSSFTAKFYNKQVILDWKTETEVNNFGFEVERSSSSTSPLRVWEKIGFVQGNGNSNSPKIYSFKDENLLGGNKFYYRLKQIDNDGQFAYSDEIEVGIIPAVFALEQNYPNPFNPTTKIRYQLPKKSNVSLKIFNSLGEEVVVLVDEIKEPGNYEVDFIGSNLSSGVYFYRMQAENFVSSKKMVIIK